MALDPKFPKDPFVILDPNIRWFPGDQDLFNTGREKLLPPFVHTIRKKVYEWRISNYDGVSDTSQALLRWWFLTEHPKQTADGQISFFQYYFAQREAIETIIYLYEIAKIKDKYDLIRFDSSGIVSAGMFEETWLRFVIKMATGSGKTKVISLLLAWSYFHKIYEEDSKLSRNFLIITPNIIVLDRLRTDFDGLKIFFEDPILPENGYEGRDWKNDFQITLHIQDEIGKISKSGNIFLTNIHRVYQGDIAPADANDEDMSNYFLGAKPVGATNDSKLDLGDIIRDVNELMVFNDEAHHIHDDRLSWFKSIEDISNRLKMKGGQLSLQIDLTATPKKTNGSIFVQTVCDYPLVEAIHQNVVKHPVLPDPASRAKLVEHKSSKFSEKYKDYIHLGYLEWKKVYEEHIRVNKKAVLFVMTDDTKNCDDVAKYLENTYQEFKDSVLVIHTKNNGEISETSVDRNKEELKKLREAANKIDKLDNQYKVIVSVLMLKEGWDVRNVTTIVGLRPYAAQSNILPEQTLGRGLRRMYQDPDFTEFVSVVGTDAFMDFVESIKNEGVELEYAKMGPGSGPKTPLVIEIDRENLKKDIEKLDIRIPVLTPRIYREYKNLTGLDVSKFKYTKITLREFSEKEKREIIFRDITTDQITHKTELDVNFVPDYQSVIGFFAQIIMRELRLVGGYDVLYGKIKEFVQDYLFDKQVQIDDLNLLRNLSEIEATRTVIETFKKEINDLTVLDRGEAEIRDYIKISKSRPFIVKNQEYIAPQKSIFNKVVGDSHFELEIASCLEAFGDIISYTKNYFAVHFKIDYRNSDGNISDYYPDFIVKVSSKEIYIVESKGREDLDDIEKIKRLNQWCSDINKVQKETIYKMLLIKQEDWDKQSQKPKSFEELIRTFSYV